jgi:hypothetical protein
MYKSLNLKKISIYLGLFLLYFFFRWRQWPGEIFLIIIPGLIVGHIIHCLVFNRLYFKFNLLFSSIAFVGMLCLFIFRYNTWLAFYVFIGAFIFSFCIDFINSPFRKGKKQIQEKLDQL